MTNNKTANISYILEINDPASHYFEVQIEFINFNKDDAYLDLILPVWRPGRYLIFDFASGVQDFKSYDRIGKPLKWEKINKCTWRVRTGSASNVFVTYKMFANEINLRTKGLDQDHAFVNGTSVFMYSEKLRKEPLTLLIKSFDKWHITTGLERADRSENLFYAPNYDYLADCPLEIGNQKDYEFNVDGRKHIISFFGDAHYDIDRLTNDFTKIIKKNHEFWGKVPYEKYVFIIHCKPQSSGGTEHINSTVVGVKPNAFETDASYKSFLRLISHEFFHTWNVKQFKPAGLSPYDYTKENYTAELWIAEGGTSYYDGLMLTRTGQMTANEFYDKITKGIEDERRRPGYRVQSAAESSFDAWVKFWKQSPNAYNAESDYYAMGSYVCMVLDLEIRNASNNKHSLDDVFKAMFERFPLDKKGYANDDFRKICEEFAAIRLAKFFADYVFGIEPIDWEKYLFYAGLNVVKEEKLGRAIIGLLPAKIGDKIMVASVHPGSSADRAGIIKGDEIIACDEMRMSQEEIEKKLDAMKAGDKITLTIFRANKLMRFALKLEEHSTETYKIEKVKNPTEQQKAIYEKWLEIKW
ncbi:MAG TPA: PDZ domain-containing protein [Ignavibacteria bacterium]|jgi:predicted metalloprotease with PDZ domain